MLKYLAFVMLIACASCSSEKPHRHHIPPKIAENSDERQNIEPFISNGAPAVLGQFPYQVGVLRRSLDGDSSSICNAAFIKHQWVLTSVTCVSEVNMTYTLVFGAIDLTSNIKTWQSDEISRDDIKMHPGYNDKTLANNIALIFVQNMTDLTNTHALPIDLPTEDEAKTNLFGKDVTMSGYGSNTETTLVTDGVLRYATNKVVNNSVCAAFPTHFVTDGSLCVETSGGRSTCHSDFGSPLTIDLTEDRKVLAGIASYIVKPCTETPAMFESVFYHREWIEKTINGSSVVSLSMSLFTLGIAMILKNLF